MRYSFYVPRVRFPSFFVFFCDFFCVRVLTHKDVSIEHGDYQVRVLIYARAPAGRPRVRHAIFFAFSIPFLNTEHLVLNIVALKVNFSWCPYLSCLLSRITSVVLTLMLGNALGCWFPSFGSACFVCLQVPAFVVVVMAD